MKAKLSFDLSLGERLLVTLDRQHPEDLVAVEQISEAIAEAWHLPRSYLGGWFLRMDQTAPAVPTRIE